MTSSMRHGARLLAMVLGVAVVLTACGQGTKQAAQSFGAALAETFREVGDEMDKALRKSAAPK